MVRGLASHHHGLGLIPGLGITWGLSLLLVLVLALTLFLQSSGFPPPTKPSIPNLIGLKTVDIKSNLYYNLLLIANWRQLQLAS